jgi:hypothetical protein
MSLLKCLFLPNQKPLDEVSVSKFRVNVTCVVLVENFDVGAFIVLLGEYASRESGVVLKR